MRYRLPRLLMLAGGILIGLSVLFPWWHLQLDAPQYPGGLDVNIYANRIVGEKYEPNPQMDVLDQIDLLNHYIGMKSLSAGAKFERKYSLFGIAAVVVLLLVSLAFRNRLALVFALPAMVVPFAFLGDLQYWLWWYGHTLDKGGPLGFPSFTPQVLGSYKIGQFSCLALPNVGLLMTFAATALIALGLMHLRRAYRALAGAGDDVGVETAEDVEDGGAAEGTTDATAAVARVEAAATTAAPESGQRAVAGESMAPPGTAATRQAVKGVS